MGMIRHAQKQALLSQFRRARVGAVVAKGARILATGHNAIRNFALVKRPYPESTHAEVAAIGQLLKARRLHDLAGATLYVCRVGRLGESRLSRPCCNCESLARAVGIRRVIFTTDGGTDGYAL